MKREILFKAKIINSKIYPEMNGKWYEGYYTKDLNNGIIKHYLFNCPTTFEIDPETLCQFTGVTDRNDNRIFESDILVSKRFTFTVEWSGLGFKFVNSISKKSWASSSTKSLTLIGNSNE